MNSTAKNLGINTKKILDTVSRGEEVIITSNGKPFAKIIPFTKTVKKKETDTDLFGIWKDRSDLNDASLYVQKLRSRRFYDND